MNEEEKKELKEIIDLLYTGNLSQYGKRKLVNYIEKQQKEIEELKEKNASLQKEIKLMKSININDNYISKDKIREKIKELEEQMKQDEVDEFGIHSIGWSGLDYVVEQLEKLLEE